MRGGKEGSFSGGGGGEESSSVECSVSFTSPPRITPAFETYFSAPRRRREGGIKVLAWRGGVSAEGRGVKRWQRVILAGLALIDWLMLNRDTNTAEFCRVNGCFRGNCEVKIWGGKV